MRPFIQEIQTSHTAVSLVESLHAEPGVVLLRSALFDSTQARYSFVTARPFLTFRSFGSRCELTQPAIRSTQRQFGNPWQILDSLMSRYELLDEVDLPFPLGGCFGYWGYDLKNFVEPRLPRRAVNDLELPDCHVGFYDSLIAFDHRLGKTWIISTGLGEDGSRNELRARQRQDFWEHLLNNPGVETGHSSIRKDVTRDVASVASNLSREEFIAKVERAQRYIRAGDIYQVNLSQRLVAHCRFSGWEFFQQLSAVSPAPFSAYLDCGEFQIASSSPELFLRLSGSDLAGGSNPLQPGL